MDTRIPLDDFSNFPRCTLNGLPGSIGWVAAMEAYEASRIEQKKANQAMLSDAPIFDLLRPACSEYTPDGRTFVRQFQPK